MTSAQGDAAPSSLTARFFSREWLVVLSLIIAILALDIATGNRFPCVWMDEVQHTDPAANLYLGNGFTSTAWYVQTSDKFWAGSVPLHHGLLYLWMQVFGFDLLAVRTLNYALVSFAILLLWLTVRRLQLIPSVRGRILFVVLLLFGYGPSICARGGRYDGITIAVAAFAACMFSVVNQRNRLLLLVATGFLFPFAGLQLIAFGAVFSALLILFTGWKWFRECASLGIGIILGGIALRQFYVSHGVWDDFLATVRYSLHVVTGSIPKDPSLLALLLPAFLLGFWFLLKGTLRWRSLLVFSVVSTIWIPLGMKLVGRFPTYYSWMAYVPLAIGVSALTVEVFSRLPRVPKLTLTFLLLIPCLVGLPLQLVSTFCFWKERDYSQVEKLAADHIQSDDWVFCDPEPYYAVKKHAARTFLSCYEAVTPEENAHINVMVVRPYHAASAVERLGGKWVRSPNFIPPIALSSLWDKLDENNKLIWDYSLEVWRKLPAETAISQIAQRK